MECVKRRRFRCRSLCGRLVGRFFTQKFWKKRGAQCALFVESNRDLINNGLRNYRVGRVTVPERNENLRFDRLSLIILSIAITAPALALASLEPAVVIFGLDASASCVSINTSDAIPCHAYQRVFCGVKR